MPTTTDTIRGALGEAIDEINKLISATSDPDEARQLHVLRELLFDIWEAVIKQEVDDSTGIYTKAIGMLKDAETAAEAAQEDIEKIADVIKKAASVAKLLDKALKLGLNVAKYFP